MEEKNKFEDVIEALGEVALEDNYISYDEFQIIKQVSFDIIRYDKALAKALEDGIISEAENKLLIKLKNQIRENIISVALEDRMIIGEEILLIKKLSEIWNEYF